MLAFWLHPDWSTGSNNLHDPNAEPFWMREPLNTLDVSAPDISVTNEKYRLINVAELTTEDILHRKILLLFLGYVAYDIRYRSDYNGGYHYSWQSPYYGYQTVHMPEYFWSNLRDDVVYK